MNILLVIILSILLQQQVIFCNDDISDWLDYLRSENLALSESEVDLLMKNPNALRSRKVEIAGSYQLLIQEIEKKRVELSVRYVNDYSQPNKTLEESERYLIAIISKLLVPLWMGGKWDINGVPGKKPNLEKGVACSHFVQKILVDSGFNIKKRNSTWLAYLGPKDILKSVDDTSLFTYNDYDNFSTDFTRLGDGIYLIGLDHIYWGTVAFGLLQNETDLILMHSGIHPKGSSVNYENGKKYLAEFQKWREIHVLKLSKNVIDKWLRNKKIIPIKEQ